jgi:hypothetical protein
MQLVEFGDDERIARADGSERLVKAGSVAVGSGQPMVGIDALREDTFSSAAFSILLSAHSSDSSEETCQLPRAYL